LGAVVSLVDGVPLAAALLAGSAAAPTDAAAVAVLLRRAGELAGPSADRADQVAVRGATHELVTLLGSQAFKARIII
jgi:hypothetical protein